MGLLTPLQNLLRSYNVHKKTNTNVQGPRYRLNLINIYSSVTRVGFEISL